MEVFLFSPEVHSCGCHDLPSPQVPELLAVAARSVEVGMSPGDESYRQPYFYCSPWPVPELAALPKMEGSFQWHTQGFVSAVLTAEQLGELDGVANALLDAQATVFKTLE